MQAFDTIHYKKLFNPVRNYPINVAHPLHIQYTSLVHI